jgi:3-deoxy-D-manno-octulosonic-acid transferase
MPNIKFDLAAEMLEKPLEENSFRAEGPVFLFASVRSGEETRLPGQLPFIFKERPEACIIVVPRHLHRVDAWKSVLGDIGLSPLLVSEMEENFTLPRGRVLIWDRFGDLPRLYASAQAVFVGGSFGQGGQNFLESLAGGRVPCIGPSASNFLWAMNSEGGNISLKQAGLLRTAATPREVIDIMLEQASSPRSQKDVRDAFQSWLAPRLGGSAAAAGMLKTCIQKD